MYNITDHFTTPKREYKDAIDHAIDWMLSNDTGACCEIIDGDTGELLFQYKNGNVDYIEGGFARDMVNAIVHNCGRSQVMGILD